MKLNGVKICGANVEYIVIPRGDANLTFKATAILDMKRFHDLCQRPKAPGRMAPGGATIPDTKDPIFLQAIKNYSEQRFAFIIVESLRDSEGLEWETVDLDSPDTWINYEKELKEAGFSEKEIEVIVKGCLIANALSEDKLEEARRNFLATLIPQDSTQKQ